MNISALLGTKNAYGESVIDKTKLKGEQLELAMSHMQLQNHSIRLKGEAELKKVAARCPTRMMRRKAQEVLASGEQVVVLDRKRRGRRSVVTNSRTFKAGEVYEVPFVVACTCLGPDKYGYIFEEVGEAAQPAPAPSAPTADELAS